MITGVCAPQDVDKATSSRIALEKKLEQMEVEIEFLKRVHQQVDTIFIEEVRIEFGVHFLYDDEQFPFFSQEIEELMNRIYSAHASAHSVFALPDLAAALKQIQTQYDDIAAKNLQVK